MPSPADENDRNKIGIGREGGIYVIEDVTVDATDAAGDFNEVTEARFRGVSNGVPSGLQLGQYYFNSRDLTWYDAQQSPFGRIDPHRTTLQAIVGGSVVFLGVVADVDAARNAITNFDTNTQYYAVYGGKFYHLDNSTYVAHTDGTTTPEWIKISGFTPTQLAAISRRIDELEREIGEGITGSNLERLIALTADLQQESTENWVDATATQGVIGIFNHDNPLNATSMGIL